jgi:hypothetical protein
MKIGETFKYEGRTYMAKEIKSRGKPCTGCAFRRYSIGCSTVPRCTGKASGNEVIYVEVTK